MADGHIQVRISAAADRSVEAVFGSIEKRGTKMRDNLNRSTAAGLGGSLSKQARDTERAAAAAERAAKRKADAETREAARATREVERHYRMQQAALERAARAQDAIMERSARTAARLRDREAREAIRTANREAREADSWARKNAYRTAYHGVVRYFPGAVGMASRTAMDVLRGAGIDPSIAGSVGRATSLNSAAVGLANQERIATGSSRGPAFYENLVRSVGNDLSTNPENAVELMRSFTARTGEFKIASDQLKDMASVALASGANFQEFGAAAGYVFNQLKGMPDAGTRTMAVMRGIVGQTAVGAVEMEEYAKQMGRIAANAHMMEGATDKNIMTMSALAQYVVEAGGGTGGADAARSLVSLMTTPQKGARAKAFKKFGVNLYTDQSQTQLRNIVEIIKDSISNSGGSLPALNQMWMDVLGAKSVKGLSAAYRDAYGATAGSESEKDAAGRRAIDSALDKYMKAQLDKATEEKNVAEHQKSIAAKAQAFQNNLDKIVSVTATQLIPPLERAAPHALRFAEAMGRVAAWAAENPGKAITAAFVLSIARAGAESLIRARIEQWFRGPGGGFAGGPMITGGGYGGGMRPPPGMIIPGGTFGGAVRAGGVGAAFNAVLGGALGYGAGSAVDAMVGSESSGLFGKMLGGAGAGAAYGPLGALIGAGAGSIMAIPQLWKEMWQQVDLSKQYGGATATAVTGAEYDRRRAAHVATAQIVSGAGGAAGPPKIIAEIDYTQFEKAQMNALRGIVQKVEVVSAVPIMLRDGARVDPAGRGPN